MYNLCLEYQIPTTHTGFLTKKTVRGNINQPTKGWEANRNCVFYGFLHTIHMCDQQLLTTPNTYNNLRTASNSKTCLQQHSKYYWACMFDITGQLGPYWTAWILLDSVDLNEQHGYWYYWTAWTLLGNLDIIGLDIIRQLGYYLTAWILLCSLDITWQLGHYWTACILLDSLVILGQLKYFWRVGLGSLDVEGQIDYYWTAWTLL